jgi:endonuclease/exonuclease/phosphatase family metal-dependent hydrolase
MADPETRELAHRLQRMEEALAFAQRDDEETLARLVEIDKVLRSLMVRIDRIEARTRELGEAASGHAPGEKDPADTIGDE